MTFYVKALLGFTYTWSSWRRADNGGEIEWSTRFEKSLRAKCTTKPVYTKSDNLQILFVGFTSNGKTTAVSNILSSMADRVRYIGGCYGDKRLQYSETITGGGLGGKILKGGGIARSVTVKLHKIEVTSGNEQTFYSFLDSPGIIAQDDETTENVKLIISGGKVQPESNIMDTRLKPCSVVFVMDSTKLSTFLNDTESRKIITDILQHAEEKDVPVEVLLTMCDKLSGSLKDSSQIRDIFYLKAIEKCVKEASRLFNNMPENRIHPTVPNIRDLEPNMENKILYLLALKNILGSAEGFGTDGRKFYSEQWEE